MHSYELRLWFVFSLSSSESLTVLKLPLEKNNIEIDGCKSYTLGQNSLKQNRIVMFLGETGSGKSTLIDGMINYILGIDWEDSFRCKLVDEGQLEAINAAKIPCPKTNKGLPVHTKFNNSALFADNRSVRDRADEDFDDEMVNNLGKMFWTMGAKNMKKFFTTLDKMPTRSLQLTKEVLNKQKQLEAAVEGLQPQVRTGLVEKIRSTPQPVEKRNATFNENSQIEVEINKPVKTKVITNCQQCSVTSHHPRAIADHRENRRCAAMSDGKFRVKTEKGDEVIVGRPKATRTQFPKKNCCFL